MAEEWFCQNCGIPLEVNGPGWVKCYKCQTVHFVFESNDPPVADKPRKLIMMLY